MDDDQKLFAELKGVCVPLLANARLDPRTIPKAFSLLASLSSILRRCQNLKLELKPNLVSYAFFPLSSLLSRNDPQSIPDRVLEAVFEAMELLFHWWWWTCEAQVWTQVVMLAGSVLGVGGKGKGKSRERAEETKEAAARLLLSLLRDRSSAPGASHDIAASESRLAELQLHAQNEGVVPIFGQTLSTLLDICSTTEHLPLQSATLEAVQILAELYVPLSIVPTILPGVVSTMTRVALGQPKEESKGKARGKGWVNGEVVAASLRVMDSIIVRAVGDEVCLKAGIVKDVTALEDLTELVSDAFSQPFTPDYSMDSSTNAKYNTKVYETALTQSYLRATVSQLLIALNASLPPLLSHPTPSALVSLCSLSCSLLHKTRLTLPNIRPLLIGILLTLSNNPFPSVSKNASSSLTSLLHSECRARYEVLQSIMQIASDALGSLPRLIPAHSDTQVIHVTGQIEAICRLGTTGNDSAVAIRTGVSKLLGPTGGIEKWGWRLLSALRFQLPNSPVAAHGALLLESETQPSASEVVFPQATVENVSSVEARTSLEKTLRALGRTTREGCLFSVEWLVTFGSQANRKEAPAALWCACRILEGVVGVDLSRGEIEEATKSRRRGRALEKFARWLGKLVSDFWDRDAEASEEAGPGETQENGDVHASEDQTTVEYIKGLTLFETRFDILSAKETPRSGVNGKESRYPDTVERLLLRKAFALQLLSLTSFILESRVTTLLIHALYPVLHSLVSSSSFLSATAFAALQYISNSAGYASPANLLLSNFDYALDGASRRLTKRRLDPEAPKVLVVLIRLVGKNVVERAGDVVEECFDRLDEYHGYTIIVEGLIEVLLEVVRAVESEMDIQAVPTQPSKYAAPPPEGSEAMPDGRRLEILLHWLKHRKDIRIPSEEEGYGSAPREAWGKGKGKELLPEEEEEEKRLLNNAEDLADPPATPTQALVSHIISRSLYFLTHGDPPIRCHVLALLTHSVPVLATHESTILPVVHKAWPFVVNRLGDAETYVVSAAAGLIEALVMRHGSFMAARVWEDVWPRFRVMLDKLDIADSQSALSRRSGTSAFAQVGTETVYTHTHRLYRAMLRTMTAVAQGGVQTQDRRTWDVLLAFRRFLHSGAHSELQKAACALYTAFGMKNSEAVWLVLVSTAGLGNVPILEHLHQERWDIKANLEQIMASLDRPDE